MNLARDTRASVSLEAGAFRRDSARERRFPVLKGKDFRYGIRPCAIHCQCLAASKGGYQRRAPLAKGQDGDRQKLARKSCRSGDQANRSSTGSTATVQDHVSGKRIGRILGASAKRSQATIGQRDECVGPTTLGSFCADCGVIPIQIRTPNIDEVRPGKHTVCIARNMSWALAHDPRSMFCESAHTGPDAIAPQPARRRCSRRPFELRKV